jgi:UDP-glucose 4-epimerase
MKVLVTCGAAISKPYHEDLGEKGTILLYTMVFIGHDWALLPADSLRGPWRQEIPRCRFCRREFDAVVHMAAFIVVDESIREPLKYYQ